MIYLITDNSWHPYYEESFEKEKSLNNLLKVDYKLSDGIEFLKFLKDYKGTYLQLDTETNIVNSIYGWKGYLKGKNKDYTFIYDEEGNRTPEKRICYYVQVGSEDGNNQFIFDVLRLNNVQKQILNLVFENPYYKLIHNALFDYAVIKANFNIDINHIRDTMLASQILTTGLEVGEDLPVGYHSLAGCCERILNYDLDKSQQTTFTEQPLTLEQLKYAAIDVVVLPFIYKHFVKELEKWSLINTFVLECATVRSYGDSMVENLYLNKEKWNKNIERQEQTLIKLYNEFNELLLTHLYEECASIGVLNKNPKYEFSWNSKTFKTNLFKKLYTNVTSNFSKIDEYKTLQKNLDPTIYDLQPLSLYVNKRFEDLELYLINNYNDILVDLKIFIPKNYININLNSPAQTLSLFKFIDPNLQAVNKDTLKKIKHPLVDKYKEIKKAEKFKSSYGVNFLLAANPDSMFRVENYSQILSTGRSSMSLLQLLPQDNDYRTPFEPNNPDTGLRDDGNKWVVVGADYSS